MHSRVPRLLLFAVLLLLTPAAGTRAQDAPLADVRTVRVAQPIVVDGRLNDEAWALVEPATSFTQRDPDEGQPATERTEVRFLYDNDSLYVGVRLFDSAPDAISRRLSRRDEGADADTVALYLDTMHDHLTGAVFRVSAANVQQDQALYNDSWNDTSWDAVWDSEVSVDADGWSVEMRIPLSQLRFAQADRHTWGVNVERYIRRKNENAWLVMVPKNDNGLASRMPHLVGLDGVRPKRTLELLPYTAGRAEFIAPQRAADPFNDGSRAFAAAGLDVKWGLTSNLRLNGTVNPDFGQVEVDPAVVNLTQFETFFDEKRPFFLEGSQIFGNFGFGGSNGFSGFNMEDPQIFYSRRIGRAPQLSAGGDFADTPAATTILGATKLTGKTSGGWSIGVLEAITGRETAPTRTGAIAARSDVEPLTNYFVGRVQREIGQRAGVGMLLTAVNRRLDTPRFRERLADQAYVAGTDAHLFLDSKRDWVVTGKLATSRVSGSTLFLERLQRAPQRYYQRPDAPHVDLETARTSLSGYSSRVVLNRNTGWWFVNAQYWDVSPGFESNDLGFGNRSDRAGAHAMLFLRDTTPGTVLRSKFFWVAKWWNWNYDRERQGDGVNGSGQFQFMNYWNLNVNVGWRRAALDDRLTRGGPSAVAPGGRGANVNFATDGRKPFSVSGNVNQNWGQFGGRNQNVNVSFNIKPSPLVTISTGPQWNRNRNVAQYIRTVDDPTATATYGQRYVFGDLRQSQLTLTTRVSVILTPRVSLQVFAQPLLAAGDYEGFKELAAPRTFDFLTYGGLDTPIARDVAADEYVVDPDGVGGTAPVFTFSDPDFNFKSLRLNAVFRWELKPGSTFFAVWTRQQQDTTYPGVFSPARDTRALFGAPGDDVILFKLAYWIGR